MIGSNGSTGIDLLNWHGCQSKPSVRRVKGGHKVHTHKSQKHDFSLSHCLPCFIGVYFADISIQSTRHNRSEAEMFAHPNNEGIRRKKKVLLLVEGHQQPENTRMNMGSHATVGTNTHKQVNKQARNRQRPHKNTNSNLFTFCLHTQTRTHRESGVSC